MLIKIGSHIKLRSTFCADMLWVIVANHVDVQTIDRLEPSVVRTDFAFMGPLIAVNLLMTPQVLLLSKALSASSAHKRFFPCVRSNVTFEVSIRLTIHFAVFASKICFIVDYPLMTIKTLFTGVLLFAGGTFEIFLNCFKPNTTA